MAMLPDPFSAPSLQKWLQNSRDGSGNETSSFACVKGTLLMHDLSYIITLGHTLEMQEALLAKKPTDSAEIS